MNRMTKECTPIYYLGELYENNLYIKREDFIPFSFGGNKARKAELFFDEIDQGGYDCVVTYGSSSSNHCRIVANMCRARGIECYIISPEEASEGTYNSIFMELFGAVIKRCSVVDVRNTIDSTVNNLKKEGRCPYFIPGGGHGNIGTQAYVECYDEIRKYEKDNNIHFDYIFHASGTGTTQAGLICGQLTNNDERKIIGISIARKNPRGRNVVLESVRDYLIEKNVEYLDSKIETSTIFLDDFVGEGYGSASEKVNTLVGNLMAKYGVAMDTTYTGKAAFGMVEYLKGEMIHDSNVLFIHTGGTPLYFDYLKMRSKRE